MSRIDNLGENKHKLTAEEASKGGKKSVEARAAKKDLKAAIEAMLERDYTDSTGQVYSGAQVIAAKLFEKAKKGDVRAFEVLRDTAGQKPAEKVIVSDVDPAVVEAVEKAVMNNDDEETGS